MKALAWPRRKRHCLGVNFASDKSGADRPSLSALVAQYRGPALDVSLFINLHIPGRDFGRRDHR